MNVGDKNPDATKSVKGQNFKIIVIEDDDGLNRLIQKKLQKEGYETDGAMTGQEALAKTSGNKNEILLIDYKLPDMTGKLLTKQLIEKYDKVPPIIVITGFGDEKVAVEMMKLGVWDYMVKEPDFIDILPEKIKHICEDIERNKKLEKAEDDLRKNLEVLNDTGDMARVGGWELDLIKNTVYWTQSTKKIHEVAEDYIPTLEEAINFYPQESRPLIEKLIDKALKEGKAYDIEIPIITAKGNKLWTHSIGKPEMQDGKCIRLRGTFQDITARKIAEEELKSNQATLKRTQKIAKVGSWDWDIASDTVAWSDELYQIFRLNPEKGAVSYTDHPKIYTPQSMQRLETVVRHTIETGEPYEIDLEIIRGDGTNAFCTARGLAKKDKKGKVIQLYGSFQDISERKQLEAELQETSEFLKETEKTGQIGGWQFDPVTLKQTWTDEVFRILEIDLEHGAPEVPKGLEFIDPQFRPMAEKAIQRAMEQGEPYNQEWITTTAKGNKKWVNAVCNPKLNNGKVVTISGSFQDITSRKIAEEQLKALNQQLVANEQQLKASNQQLSASEQQLLAANQQLQANEQQLKAAIQQLLASEQQLKAANQQLQAGEQQLRALNQQLIASEKESRNSKETAERYLNIAAEIILSLDSDGHITLLNDSGYRLLGYEVGTLIGKDWFSNFLPKEQEIAVRSVFGQLMKGEAANVSKYESDIVTKSGEIKTILWHNTVLKDKNGKITGTLSSGEDITERKKAEQELIEAKERAEESEKRLNEAQRIAKVGNWFIDFQNGHLKWSKACYSIFEINENIEPENLRTALGAKIHPDDLIQLDKLNKQAIENSESFKFEYRVILKSGIKNILLISEPVLSAENKLIGTRGTIQDVTENKKAEQELKNSEQKYRNIAENLPGIALRYKLKTDGTDELLYISKGVEDLYEISQDDALKNNKLIWDRVHKDDLDAYVASVKASAKNLSFWRFEHRIQLPDSRIKWIYMSGVPVKQEDGSIIWDSIGLDITERITAEEELKKIEWLLQHKKEKPEAKIPEYGDLTNINHDRTILDSVGKEVLNEIVSDYLSLLETSAAVYEKNGDYAVGIFSSEWCQFMDYSSRALCKCKDNRKALESGKWICHESCWSDASNQAIQTNKTVDIECSGGLHIYAIPIRANNKAIGAINFGYGNPPTDEDKLKGIAARYNVSLIKLKNLAQSYETRPAFIIDIAKEKLETSARLIGNIVERKQMEVALIKAKEKAEESDRLKSAFLANMSHEIRTPMNGILGFTSLLQEPDLTGEEQQIYIDIIQKSGDRMLNTVNDIMDISRIESGQVELSVSEVNINEQLNELHSFFNPEAAKKGIQLTFKNDLSEQDFSIKTDLEKLNSILTNLIKNAIKFTNQGSIELGYELKKGNGSAEVEFYVKDTGIGIPKDRQKAVFDRFVQADIEDKQAKQGSGLGLAISKAYAEMLGGKIWVESEPEQGSVFYFTIPYIVPLESESDIVDVFSTDRDADKIKKLNIVIAEDDITSEMLLEITIKPLAQKVLITRTGTETVEVCRNNPNIDLVLMDIQMPGMNGYEATRQIREFNKDVIIIAQTAFALNGDKEKALEAGCNDFISKPINKFTLIELIRKQLI